MKRSLRWAVLMVLVVGFAWAVVGTTSSPGGTISPPPGGTVPGTSSSGGSTVVSTPEGKPRVTKLPKRLNLASLPPLKNVTVGPTSLKSGLGLVELMLVDPILRRKTAETSLIPEEAQAAVWAMANTLSLSDSDVAVLTQRLATANPKHPALLATLLWAVSLRPDRVPVETVASLLHTHGSVEVRVHALRTLGVVKTAAAVEALTTAASQDADPDLRREAIFFLTLRVSASRAYELASQAWGQEASPVVRAQWLNFLGMNPSPEGSAMLQKALFHSQEALEVRKMAAEMIVAQSPSLAGKLVKDASLPGEVRAHIVTITTPRPTDPPSIPCRR